MDTGHITRLQATNTKGIGYRKKTLIFTVVSVAILVAVVISGSLLRDIATTTDMSNSNIKPCLEHIFGTDWLGRDMFARTLTGLSISILIGLLASVISTFIAIILGCVSALGGKFIDGAIGIIVDSVMGVPHMLLLILISYALGRGTVGVIIAVAVSHWPSVTRIIRGEILQLRESNYIKIAEQLGQTKFQISLRHMIPHVIPQIFIGFVLLFPHAILHEASITFLGFGMPPEQPAIGMILSESMKYLVIGEWWLVVFPGILLLIVVLLFDRMGEGVRKLLDPSSTHF